MNMGDDCVEFPERRVCFSEGFPQYLPASVNLSLNHVATASRCQTDAPWHLARLQDPPNRSAKNYNFDNSGRGREFDVYVLDTWIDTRHPQFENRATEARSFIQHDSSEYPAHGTHCAGLVAGARHGVAKYANIKAVPVLNDDGFGDYGTMIRAAAWILQQVERTGRKSVVSMSIGGPRSAALNRALESLFPKFALVVVAAGNDGSDACETSPASANVITVGATTFDNKFADFSNRGRCVDILAPGQQILSLCPRGAECWMSGTSMACPIVAGALVEYWATRPDLSVSQVWSNYRRVAERGVVSSLPAQTTDLFATQLTMPKCFYFEEQYNADYGDDDDDDEIY